MKIKPEHLQRMREAIQPHDTPERRAEYRAGRFPRAALVKNLDMRYRWDLLYASKHSINHLYGYLDDSHIDTALRAIVPALEVPNAQA